MRYTATDGTTRHGEVWSPGPLPGTVWVLPYSGAPSSQAVVVKMIRKTGQWITLSASEVERMKAQRVREWKTAGGYISPVGPRTECEIRAAHRQAFNDGRGLPAKDWYAALGYDPRDVARQTEQLALTDMAA